MVEAGDIRIRRNGTLVKVVDIYMKHSTYWKRDMPYVTLTPWPQENYQIVRALGTVESYPLAPQELTTPQTKEEDMSLNWNLEDIDDHKEVCWLEDGSMNPVTHAIIIGTISVGLGRISPTNVDEFVARFRIIEKLHGPFLTAKDQKDRYITDEEFAAHIGLTTNVSSETRAQWSRRIFVNKQTSITDDWARNFRMFQHRQQKETVSG